MTESPTDDEVIRILIEAVLQEPTEPAEMIRIAARGVKGVIDQVLVAAIRQHHWDGTVDALAVVVDTDSTPVHEPQHDEPGKADPACRLCRMRQKADHALSGMATPSHRGRELHLLLGVAEPTIEAWFLSAADAGITEAAWRNGLKTGRPPYTRDELKQRAYGQRTRDRHAQRERAIAYARQLASEIGRLEAAFPTGFGAFAASVRACRTSS